MKTARELAKKLHFDLCNNIKEIDELYLIESALIAYGDAKLEEACRVVPMGIEWQQAIRALKEGKWNSKTYK